MLGLFIGLFVYAQILLPILYGLPKSIWLFYKREVRFFAIISQLIPPVLWLSALFVLGFIIELIYPSLNRFLIGNPAFNLGQIFSVIALLLSFLFPARRADMKADYENSTYLRYRKNKE